MKRIIALVLCLVMACLALVSCSDEIGEDLQGYYDRGFTSTKSESTYEIDMYIPVDYTAQELKQPEIESAYNTVQARINEYIESKYYTKLYIHFIAASDYASVVTEAVKPGYIHEDTNGDNVKDSKDRVAQADIVLINDIAIYDALVDPDSAADTMLLPVDTQIDTSKYGTLNADIARTLWDACKETVGESELHYVIPNNRVIGSYEYLLVDRTAALANNLSENYFRNEAKCLVCGEYYDAKDAVSYTVNITDADPKTVEIAAGTKYQDLIAAIKTGAAIADGTDFTVSCTTEGCTGFVEDYKALDFNNSDSASITELATLLGQDNVIKADGMMYEEKAMLESGTHPDYPGRKFIVNVLRYPEVDLEYVCESAFGIVRDNEHAQRAMQIVYQINSDETLRNLLQYGVENIHYTKDNAGVVTIAASCTYKMNLEYSGNVFLAYPTTDAIWKGNAWTVDCKVNGQLQNAESTLK